MWNIINFFALSVILSYAKASYYYGPFMLWGQDDLRGIKLSALEAIEAKVLGTIFEESKVVILFLRNGTTKLNAQNYPTFKEMTSQNPWIYLPQHSLPADPIDFNRNVEVIDLVGPASQQDTELSALFHDAENSYGKGKVLGMLANQMDEHSIFKRQAVPEKEDPASSTSISSTTSPITPDTPTRKFFTYKVEGKALLYTLTAPKLNLTNADGKQEIFELSDGEEATATQYDSRGNFSRFIINFLKTGGKTTLRFRFPIENGYWSLSEVEVLVNGLSYNNTLTVVGVPPKVPVGFSYSCSRPLEFRNDSDVLLLEYIQVQPELNGGNVFSDAYNCVGFTTVPIWSGIFISFIIICGTFIGLLAILDIKTPTRFENNRNKQLTFTVQE